MTISNACNIPLSANSGTLPNLQDALLNWFQLMSFTVITKTIVDFKLIETTNVINFRGVIQPLSPQELNIKPIGQRDWVWKNVHTTVDLILKPDDRFIYLGVRYRVMSKWDYSQYGYLNFHCVEDWT